MPSSRFNPDSDIPDLSDKIILVTGGNSGLGAESCLQLAKHNPAEIFLGARSKVKADEAIATIRKTVPNAKITVLEMDLTDLASVKKAADTFLAASSRLDILMNNAGIMACPAGVTKDGIEIQLGTNHVGHFLLTKLLLPRLRETAQQGHDVRIINVSSRAHKWATPGLNLQNANTDMASISSFARYGNSKMANVFFTQELAKRYPEIVSISLHPGDVNTNLIGGLKQSYSFVPEFIWKLALRFGAIAVQEGALNQLWASVSKDAKSGMYYDPVGRVVSTFDASRDEPQASELWDWTEAELAKRGF
ncbi:hypothetical protein KCU91_g5445, partial [Aureobasidium melanogenum]